MKIITGVLLLLLSIATMAQQPAPVAPTEISADLGTCSAEFHVTDMQGNPLYNAKVHTLIRYGFLSKRKLELEAGTSADGRVKFIKLPNTAKKPITFDVTYGDQKASYTFDPGTRCAATYDVPLNMKAPK